MSYHVVELSLGQVGIARFLSTAACMSFTDKGKDNFSLWLQVVTLRPGLLTCYQVDGYCE